MSWWLHSCERQKFNLKVFSLTSCTLLVLLAAGFNRFQNWKKIRYSAGLLLPHQLAAGLRPNGCGVEIKMDQSWKSLKWSLIGILPSSFSRSCSNWAEMQNKGFVTGILMLSQIECPKYCSCTLYCIEGWACTQFGNKNIWKYLTGPMLYWVSVKGCD